MHEELNIAPSFPLEKNKESNIPESEITNKYWDLHIQRNSSIIVNLFHGQFRNEYDCYE